MLSIIVAYDKTFGIGINNALPWYLYDDLKNFKKITENHYVIMGRKTFESIGKSLPNRQNVILTHQLGYSQKNCTIIHNLEDIFQLSEQKPERQFFIIGGAQIYKATLPFVNRLYITKVKGVKKADTFFPKWQDSSFKLISSSRYKKNKYNEYNFDFEIWSKHTNST